MTTPHVRETDFVEVTRAPDSLGIFHVDCGLWLPAPRDAVFHFFADALQLERITPPWLRFRVLSPRPIAMRTGTLIDYRLNLHGWPVRWRTCIEDWEPPALFVDVQQRGPYRLWRHRHTFVEAEGGTLVEDHVDYAMFGGRIVNPLVRRDLAKIFRFRHGVLKSLFSPAAKTNG